MSSLSSHYHFFPFPSHLFLSLLSLLFPPFTVFLKPFKTLKFSVGVHYSFAKYIAAFIYCSCQLLCWLCAHSIWTVVLDSTFAKHYLCLYLLRSFLFSFCLLYLSCSPRIQERIFPPTTVYTYSSLLAYICGIAFLFFFF